MTSLASSTTGMLPTLRTGDRMSTEEFDRIYEHLHDVRAELIDGVVYVASPTSVHRHGQPHLMLATVIGVYHAAHPGTGSFVDGSLYAAGGSRVQPDVCLFRLDGKAFINQDGYLEGVPEFVAEVSNTSADWDLREKRRLYERLGVEEYNVWRTVMNVFDCFRRVNGKYEQAPADIAVFESHSFPGLRLDLAALTAGDLAAALRTLESE